MTPPYKKGLKVSLATHAAMLLALFVSGFINGCSILNREKEPMPDIEFTVEIPEDMVADAAETDTPEEEVPAPEPEPLKEEDIPAPPDPVPDEIKDPPPEPPKK